MYRLAGGALRLGALLLIALLAGCTASKPKNIDNICAIFTEKDDWYEDAAEARDAWNSSIPIMMAIMRQESGFNATARPPRQTILGFIPWTRPSNSYGYSQALESTWEAYERSAGRWGADRDDFGDSIDFIGWYNDQSHRLNGIGRKDTYRLYLAYHEGHGGYGRGSYRNKPWLLEVARKVERKAASYQSQLQVCEEKLKEGGWFSDWF
ncbi:MAG: transglycosylase SLT domain-containing protein [Gammaproteobacteria bacterium]|nr:transglycosylase SLT domain-containing protein [Gammaproteobacteria bacterium]